MKAKQILALSLAVVLSLSLMVGCTKKKPSPGTSSGIMSDIASGTSSIASGIASGASEIASDVASGMTSSKIAK